jgi:hypothetical protein
MKGAEINIHSQSELFLTDDNLWMRGVRHEVKKQFEVFITKLSMMSSRLFLEKYEVTCAMLRIMPVISRDNFMKIYEKELEDKQKQ